MLKYFNIYSIMVMHYYLYCYSSILDTLINLYQVYTKLKNVCLKTVKGFLYSNFNILLLNFSHIILHQIKYDVLKTSLC